LAGIYIHIPFCKQACHYCDFHFSTNQQQKALMVKAIKQELITRSLYLKGQSVQTIYYGGGTPSLLSSEDILSIQQVLHKHYQIVDNPETTFECNPDDLTINYLQTLKQHGINRLSIGIQSFDQDQLQKLNRAHSSEEAQICVTNAQKIGFQNITIDLMYGLPDTDITYWEKQVEHAVNLGVSHISAYCLTFEEKTVFGNWLKKGKINPLSDDNNLAQFKSLISKLSLAGYNQYEISNFAKSGAISKHNSAYWLGENYLGIGPSAHSFNGTSRQWNTANNNLYINQITNNKKHYEIEILAEKDKYNEYILTRLRTKWGLNKLHLKNTFPEYYETSEKQLHTFVKKRYLSETDTHFYITETGKFIADHLTSELFVI
jgi:oxygen-independent coproporphyrinogen-3 oxidase